MLRSRYHSQLLEVGNLAKTEMRSLECSVNSPSLQGSRQRPLPAALSGSLNKAPGFAGGYLLNDDEGMDLPSSERARAQAVMTARELVCDAIKTGDDLGFDAVVIADERGNEIASVQAGEVVPRRVR